MSIYTEEQLIKILQEQTKKLGKIPNARDIRNPSSNIYYEVFGSFNNAIKAAGLKPKRENHKYSKEDIIMIIQKTSKKLGRTPTIDEMKSVGRTVISYMFGSWNQALIESGLELSQTRIPRSKNFQNLSKEQTIMLLAGWMVQHNYTLNNAEILKDNNMPSPIFIMKKLDVNSWSKVVKLVRKSCKISNFINKNEEKQIELKSRLIKETKKDIKIRKNIIPIDENIANYLKENYSNKTNKVLAEDLNIPLSEVNKIAGKLRLKKSKEFLSKTSLENTLKQMKKNN